MNRILRTIFVIFIVNSIFVTSGLAPTSHSALRGVVKDELGGLISGATINLTSVSGEQKTAKTNANGEYEFEGLTPGKHNAVVSVAPARVIDAFSPKCV